MASGSGSDMNREMILADFQVGFPLLQVHVFKCETRSLRQRSCLTNYGTSCPGQRSGYLNHECANRKVGICLFSRIDLMKGRQLTAGCQGLTVNTCL